MHELLLPCFAGWLIACSKNHSTPTHCWPACCTPHQFGISGATVVPITMPPSTGTPTLTACRGRGTMQTSMAGCVNIKEYQPDQCRKQSWLLGSRARRLHFSAELQRQRQPRRRETDTHRRVSPRDGQDRVSITPLSLKSLKALQRSAGSDTSTLRDSVLRRGAPIAMRVAMEEK